MGFSLLFSLHLIMMNVRLGSVVGASVVFVNRSRVMREFFPPSWKKLWKAWELRGLVLLSLTCQIVLILFGNRRKYVAGIRIRVAVWLAYMLADSVANMAAGILSNDLGGARGDSSTGVVNMKPYELTALWAPLMLLHLGGTDTITAYSLEDNELWIRHLLGVATQAVTTVYILFLSWSSSLFSLLFLVIFFVGLFKYCERVWVLYSASESNFRDSIPDISNDESRIIQEYKLKELEGYHVTKHEVLEVGVEVLPEDHQQQWQTDKDRNEEEEEEEDDENDYQVDTGGDEIGDRIHARDANKSMRDHNSDIDHLQDANELITAYNWLDLVKRLLADLKLSFQDRDASKAIFTKMKPEMAFKVIEIELGLIYDLKYTKAKMVYSRRGITLRLIGMFLTMMVLVGVSLDGSTIVLVRRGGAHVDFKKLNHDQKQHHSTIDLTITLVLLGAAIILELCALTELLVSDQTAHWLIKNKRTNILQVIYRTLLFPSLHCKWSPIKRLVRGRRRRRWSHLMKQYSLITFALKSSQKPQIMKKLGAMGEFLEILTYRDTPMVIGHKNKLKKVIFEEISNCAKLNGLGTDLKDLFGRRGGRTLVNRERNEDLKWSIEELEYEQSILIWHLATEICYYSDKERAHYSKRVTSLVERGKCLSRYMLYLLVKLPYMLPIGMGRIKFNDIYRGIGEFLDDNSQTNNEGAAAMLRQTNTMHLLTVGGENGRSKYVIFNSCKLASQFNEENDVEKRWELIVRVWIEMLCHAAGQCGGRHHLQQLRRGGELFTHVWLLMAHFGLTDHFQIQHNRAVVDAFLW